VAGSTEAGYLAAIFPLPKTPTLVLIKYVPDSITLDFYLCFMFSPNKAPGCSILHILAYKCGLFSCETGVTFY